MRYLIVNADDFGQSTGVTRGIIRAHEQGIVTSTSLMVRWPAAPAAVEYAKTRPQLALGIHIDLGEWFYRDAQWLPAYHVVDTTDANAVAREIDAQLARFRDVAGRNPTHIDSHQHVHKREPAHSILMRLANEMGVPLRAYGPATYCGNFYGQDNEGRTYPDLISVESLVKIITSLPPGITELCCHPGEVDDELQTTYKLERERELAALCDPRVRRAIEGTGVELRSFANLPA